MNIEKILYGIFESNPELLEKTSGELAEFLTSGKKMIGHARNLLDILEKGIDASLNGSGQLAVEHGAGAVKGAIVDPTAPVYAEHSIMLQIPNEQLKAMEKDKLVEIITAHYHSHRPKSIEKAGINFQEGEWYRGMDVAKGLGIALRSLFAYSAGEYYKIKGNIPGYDAIRLMLRMRGNRTLSTDEIKQAFYISQPVLDRLVETEILPQPRDSRNKGLVVHAKEAAKLFDMVFPIKRDGYGAPPPKEYRARTKRVADRPNLGGEKPVVRHDPNLDAKEISSEPLQSLYREFEGQWIGFSPRNLFLGKDFAYHSNNNQNPDAYWLRTQTGDEKKVNLRDIMRQHLAKAYLTEEQLKAEFGRGGAIYESDLVMSKLAKAEMPPLTYKKKYVFPPGTFTISRIDEVTLERVVGLAHPYILQYGPFPDGNQVRVILEQQDRKSRINPESLGSMVATAYVDGTKRYNLLLVVYFQQDLFRKNAWKQHTRT